MAKRWGGTRTVLPNNFDRQTNINEYHKELRTGGYIIENSYQSDKTGAFVLFHKGHNYHQDEIDAARALADNGYNVRLTPEGDGHEIFATRVKKDGTHKFSEGTVSLFTFEQKTPNIGEDKVKSVNKAINHAIDKGSKVALIYDKNGVLHREDIAAGMKYNQLKSMKWKKNNIIVLVVNSKNNVFEHHFDE